MSDFDHVKAGSSKAAIALSGLAVLLLVSYGVLIYLYPSTSPWYPEGVEVAR